MGELGTSLRLIGYWWSPDDPGWPKAHEWVDVDWDSTERELVAAYLAGGMRAPYAAGGPSECRICGCANGNLELTDGTYLWPEGLSHYVRDHSVRLPKEVIGHVLKWMHTESWVEDSSWWREQKPSTR